MQFCIYRIALTHSWHAPCTIAAYNKYIYKTISFKRMIQNGRNNNTKTNERRFSGIIFYIKRKVIVFALYFEEFKIWIIPQKISENIHKDFEIEEEKLSRIIRIIFSVNQIQAPDGFDKEKIADDFVSALSKVEIENFSQSKAKEYLLEILKPNENIFLTVQATKLVSEREKSLQDLEIFTDIRPIFEENEMVGFTVIQTLKIEYEDGGEEKIMYLAVDSSDFSNMEKLIKTARAKEIAIKSGISGKFVDLGNE